MEAIVRSQHRGALPPLRLRLYGRQINLLREVAGYALGRARSRCELSNVSTESLLALEVSDGLASTLEGAAIVLGESGGLAQVSFSILHGEGDVRSDLGIEHTYTAFSKTLT